MQNHDQRTCAQPAPLPDTASADWARALHLRRQLEAAAEDGVDLLAALGLPRLVRPGHIVVDPVAAGDALDLAIAALDALDGDTDVEDGHDAEDSAEEAEGTALESHGRGFVRAGEDDAEDDDPAEDDDGCGDEDSGIGDVDGYHEQCGFAVAGALPWSVGGYVA